MINELRELKQYLRFYEEARDNDKMTKKEQRELCIQYTQDKIKVITNISIPLEKIRLDMRNNKIVCENYGYNNKVSLDFRFYQNKCTIWDGQREINLTIE